MSDVYRDTDHRYHTDPAFRAVVKLLERAAIEHGFTPGELKQMAFKAALNIEERRAPASLAIIGPSAAAIAHPVRTITTYRELCDAMGWVYSSEGEKLWGLQMEQPVTVVPVSQGDVKRLPCPCARCGKEVTLLNAFENTAGTEFYCGHECYRAAGAT